MGIVNDQVRLRHTVQGLGHIRMHDMGQIQPSTFPVGETVGGVASTGLLIGGLILKKTPGTVMAVVGGMGLLVSGTLLIIKLASRPAGAPAAPGIPGAPPAAPPPPPPAPKPTSYEKIMSYASQYAPAINQLFSKLFGANQQPALMVVHSRAR